MILAGWRCFIEAIIDPPEHIEYNDGSGINHHKGG
jgi:hypothetical protein